MTTVQENKMPKDEGIVLRLSSIHADESMNVRQTYDDKETEALAKSIDEEGLIQPIAVWKDGDKFMVASGFRRRRALILNASKAKKDEDKDPEVHCIFKPYANRDEAMMANLASDTSIVGVRNYDLAARYAYLNNKFKTPVTALAKMSGRDQATVSKLVTCFNDLSKEVKESWEKNPNGDQELPLSRLYKWAKLDPKDQKKALAQYMDGDKPAASEASSSNGKGGGKDGEERIDGKKPGKKAVYAEIEKIEAKLQDKPSATDAARLEGMKKGLRWGLGEIVRLH